MKRNVTKKFFLITSLLLSLTACDAGKGAKNNEEKVMVASNELKDGFKYYESKKASSILQYPEGWIKISPDSTLEDEDFKDYQDIDVDSFVMGMEYNGVDAIWIAFNDEDINQINYILEANNNLKANLMDDEEFIEEFAAQNDYDVIQNFGESGGLEFIQESAMEEFGDNKFITCHYVISDNEPAKDIHIFQAVSFSDDVRHIISLMCNEDSFDEIKKDLDYLLSTMEYF